MTGFWWVHTSGQRNQETVKFLSGPCTAEWAIDCFLYSPPSFFLNTAINFLSCLTNSFSLPSLPLALFVAEEDAQSFGEKLQTTQPVQPGWTGPVPGSFSRHQPENKNSPGICTYTFKTAGMLHKLSPFIQMVNPSIQLYPSLKVFSRIWAYSFAYYSNSVLCMALFEPHPASHSHPVSSLPSKGSQANIHQGFVPHCYGGVKDTTVTLGSIHSLIRSQADLMDGVSATVPLQWPPCLRRAPLDNSIYKTLCFWSHCINILACFLLCFFTSKLIQSEFLYTAWKSSVFFFANRVTFCPSCGRVAARLKSKDLQLEDNRCLICAVMWDEVKADRGTVMNHYEMSCPALPQSQVSCNHSVNHFHSFYLNSRASQTSSFTMLQSAFPYFTFVV